jgi:hypothetical protein
MTQPQLEQQQRKWKQTDSEIRNRKQQKTSRNDIGTGYCRVTHAQIINHKPPAECPFYTTKLTIYLVVFLRKFLVQAKLFAWKL